MCGFLGVINRKNTKKYCEEKARKVSELLSSRGPDEEGIYISKKLFLVHRRLSVIDIKGGKQPFFSEDKKKILLYNGEIYNFQKLKKRLEKNYNQSFHTDSDTEVLFKHLIMFKKKGLKELEGMFSFVFIDLEKDRVLCARDFAGQKPLFYTKGNQGYIFASEMKALFEFKSQKIYNQGLKDFFKYGYIPAPYTAYEGIYKLEPGFLLELDLKTDKIVKKRFKSIEKTEKKDDNILNLKKLIRKSVKQCLVSDVPVGAFLSGGIDSTLIVREMRKILKHKQFHTFSVGFREKNYDESDYSYKVARKYKTIHHHFYFSCRDFLKNIDEMLYFDEPFGDSSAMPLFFLSKWTKKYVKVVLSGDGADEIFGGYRRYRANNYIKLIRILPEILRKKILNFNKKNSTFFRLIKASLDKDFYSSIICIFDDFEIKKLFAETEPKKSISENQTNIFSYFIQNFSGNVSEKLMYCDFNTYLPFDILKKVDMMTMRNGLESRAPFLNSEIINTGFNFNFKQRDNKRFLKEILEKEFGKKFSKRTKKGFGVPLNSWFRGELGKYLKKEMTKNSLWKNYLNYKYVNFLIDEHKSKNKDNSYKLWHILVFIKWVNSLQREGK
ncbi:MAG: asparagine synthase (glutamine-hydrolyzing) [Candidatus Muiribacteriota bacterium]